MYRLNMQLPLSLLFAAALLIMTMVAGTYVDLRNEEMHSHHLAISTGLEKIDRYNQELSAMLVVSVLERNTLRSSSYQTVHAKLELTVASVEILTRGSELAEDITALSGERRDLRRVELDALERMEKDRWEAARDILFGEDYKLARKIYEINNETAIGALNGELMDNAAAFKRVRIISLVMRFAGLCILLWAGLMFSSRLRRELAEQARLKEEIYAANIHLEDKVKERTAELEKANDKLSELSVTDSLTGLANRRYFDEVINIEWQRARRLGLPLAVAMVDVDHFKAYNDHFGHQAGDECLRRIAVVLNSSVRRSSDLAARYGGEEFVIVLPGMKKKDAANIAETICRKVKAQNLEHTEKSRSGVVTISIGVASQVPQPGGTTKKLIEKADSALYEAKKTGRNKVVAAS